MTTFCGFIFLFFLSFEFGEKPEGKKCLIVWEARGYGVWLSALIMTSGSGDTCKCAVPELWAASWGIWPVVWCFRVAQGVCISQVPEVSECPFAASQAQCFVLFLTLSTFLNSIYALWIVTMMLCCMPVRKFLNYVRSWLFSCVCLIVWYLVPRPIKTSLRPSSPLN